MNIIVMCIRMCEVCVMLVGMGFGSEVIQDTHKKLKVVEDGFILLKNFRKIKVVNFIVR